MESWESPVSRRMLAFTEKENVAMPRRKRHARNGTRAMSAALAAAAALS